MAIDAGDHWGLDVYEQDWQDRQFVQMNYTHTGICCIKHLT